MSDLSRANRLALVVTGFGPFPGVPHNPSADVVRHLRRLSAYFARRNIALTTDVLRVHYEACANWRPQGRADVIVHIGVAARRPCVTVETRASRRRSPLAPDASGSAPKILVNGPDEFRRIDDDWLAHRLAITLVKAGVRAKTSRDAGGYVCNALLYRSLGIGNPPAIFIHVPRAHVCSPKAIAQALARVLPDVALRLHRRTPAAERPRLAA